MTRRQFVAGVAAAPFVLRLPLSSAAQHAVVVGAGAFGGWSALSLLRAGWRVTLVDAWGAGNARASSGGETRVIRAVYGGVPVYSAMVARALTLWRAAEQQWQRRIFFPTGALWLFAGDDAYARTSIGALQAVGHSIEELTPAAAARRYPQMSFADARTVFFEPQAGLLAARVACELVRETFVREGGEYRQAWVEPAVRGNRMSVLLSDGTRLSADQFIFACGPWAGRVFPDVVGRRIVATRQEIFFFGTPVGETRYAINELPVWVHVGERVVYGAPDHERRGIKIADDTAGVEVDPTTLDRVASAAGLARAREILRARFPELKDAPLLESRVCQYEASSDGDFLIDRHPQFENAWLVGGGSGHGFKMGPALGEHVAALVQGQASVEPRFAYTRLRPRP
jgi:glycine/D-amino acid oxidase-like deaminating enzyme